MKPFSDRQIKYSWGLSQTSTYNENKPPILRIVIQNRSAYSLEFVVDVMSGFWEREEQCLMGKAIASEPMLLGPKRSKMIGIRTASLALTEDLRQVFPYRIRGTALYLEGEREEDRPHPRDVYFEKLLARPWRQEEGSALYLPPLTLAAHARESLSRFKALLGRLSFDLRVPE